MQRSLSCVAGLVLATSCVQVRWYPIYQDVAPGGEVAAPAVDGITADYERHLMRD